MSQIKRKLLFKDYLIRALVGNVLLDAFSIRIFAYRICIETTCPQVSAPQKTFHFWVQLKNLLRCYALYCFHNLSHRQYRNALNQKMDMIFFHSNFNKVNFISTGYAETHFFQGLRNTVAEYFSTIFCWKHEVIQQQCLIMMFVDMLIHTSNVAYQALLLKPPQRVGVLNPIE